MPPTSPIGSPTQTETEELLDSEPTLFEIETAQDPTEELKEDDVISILSGPTRDSVTDEEDNNITSQQFMAAADATNLQANFLEPLIGHCMNDDNRRRLIMKRLKVIKLHGKDLKDDDGSKLYEELSQASAEVQLDFLRLLVKIRVLRIKRKQG